MSNEIASIKQMSDMAQVFVESGMFKDVKSQAVAVVKIQAGQEMGLEPFAAMQGIDIIQGKAVPNSSLQASLIKGSGKYNYKITKHTETVCMLQFYEKWDGKWESVGESSFSIEEATKAGLTHKDTWKKHPKNMLFARALSNGCKWFCADVFSGATYNESDIDSLEYQAVEAVDNSGVDKLKALVAPVKPEVVAEVLEVVPEEEAIEEEIAIANDDEVDSMIESMKGAKSLDELVEIKNCIKSNFELSPSQVEALKNEFSLIQKQRFGVK